MEVVYSEILFDNPLPDTYALYTNVEQTTGFVREEVIEGCGY